MHPRARQNSPPRYVLYLSLALQGERMGGKCSARGLPSYISYGTARLHAAPGRRLAQIFFIGFNATMAEVWTPLATTRL